jgi:hypothetical protein
MSVTGSWEPLWVRGVLGSEREVEVAAGIGLMLVAVWGVCERGSLAGMDAGETGHG